MFYSALLPALSKQSAATEHVAWDKGPRGAAALGASHFAKAKPQHFPRSPAPACCRMSLVLKYPWCRNVPGAEMPLSALPCSSPPCSGTVTALSGLGDVCGWKPRWGDEGSLDNLRGGRRQSFSALNSAWLPGADGCPAQPTLMLALPALA